QSAIEVAAALAAIEAQLNGGPSANVAADEPLPAIKVSPVPPSQATSLLPAIVTSQIRSQPRLAVAAAAAAAAILLVAGSALFLRRPAIFASSAGKTLPLTLRDGRGEGLGIGSMAENATE